MPRPPKVKPAGSFRAPKPYKSEVRVRLDASLHGVESQFRTDSEVVPAVTKNLSEEMEQLAIL